MAWDTEELTAQLAAVRSGISETPDGPDIEGSEETRRVTKQLVEQIDDYLLPRLANLDAPLLAAIGGSTGAGKSTITNSLVGVEVSAPGLLRPTTRVPVLICHPAAADWFTTGGVLPDLPRLTGSGSGSGRGLRIVVTEALPPGLALLDTPDIDSVEVENHELASQLLGAADLWLFVTTAARYADAVPWEYLLMAHERAIAVSVAINRIPPGAAAEVTDHFSAMLAARGLGELTVFPIGESELTDGLIPATTLTGIRSWLLDSAADSAERQRLVRATIEGAVASMPPRLDRIAAGVAREAAALSDLGEAVTTAYERAASAVADRIDRGSLLRGEVLARWHEYVGGGQIMRSLQGGISRLRDALRSVFRGGPAAAAEVQGELTSSLVTTILETAYAAADATVERWEHSPAGRQLIGDDARTLARPDRSLQTTAARSIEEWQEHVLALVRQQAEGKRLAARALSLGINTVGVSLMVVMFAHTGGITGGEVAVAGGAATVSQTLLTAIFGESAVRDMARQARSDLIERVEQLYAAEAARFHRRLDDGPTSEDVARIRAMAATLAGSAW